MELDNAEDEERSGVVVGESELFALTDAVDEDTLAWQLFAEIDGGVHLEGEAGLTIFMGEQSESFSLGELRSKARTMKTARTRSGRRTRGCTADEGSWHGYRDHEAVGTAQVVAQMASSYSRKQWMD